MENISSYSRGEDKTVIKTTELKLGEIRLVSLICRKRKKRLYLLSLS